MFWIIFRGEIQSGHIFGRIFFKNKEDKYGKR
jgi:hypothetical protein